MSPLIMAWFIFDSPFILQWTTIILLTFFMSRSCSVFSTVILILHKHYASVILQYIGMRRLKAAKKSVATAHYQRKLLQWTLDGWTRYRARGKELLTSVQGKVYYRNQLLLRWDIRQRAIILLLLVGSTHSTCGILYTVGSVARGYFKM